MSPEDRDRHRSRIGFEVEVILQAYWRPEKDPLIRAAEMIWWADELEDWADDQIRWALRCWCRDNPDRRPNPGHIVALLRKRRGTACAAKISAARAAAVADEPQRQRPDEETCQRRAAVLAETVKRLGASKRM